jgi:hypothetical protein
MTVSTLRVAAGTLGCAVVAILATAQGSLADAAATVTTGPSVAALAGGEDASPDPGADGAAGTDARAGLDAGADAPADAEAHTDGMSGTDAATPPDKIPTLTVDQLLAGRCATAICPSPFHGALGIEPIVELPIGKSFTFNKGGLADYINNTDVGVSFAAGLRVWILNDWVSFALYLSQPLTPKDSQLRATGSSFVYPATYVRRSFIGGAIGFLFDTLWIGIDRDSLNNGADGSGTAINPAFPPNAVISRVWTYTVAIQPISTFRTGIGTAMAKQKQ